MRPLSYIEFACNLTLNPVRLSIVLDDVPEHPELMSVTIRPRSRRESQVTFHVPKDILITDLVPMIRQEYTAGNPQLSFVGV